MVYLADNFRYIKIQLGSEGLEDTNKGNWMTMFIDLFCLWHLGLIIKLNFNILRVAYFNLYLVCKIEERKLGKQVFKNLLENYHL